MTAGLRRNRWLRVAAFFVGIVLFYAPFAVVARLIGAAFPASMAGTSISDAHTACMRMPIGWLVQPWMWSFMDNNPLYFVPILVLPLAALAAGPLFCGWLCPAGGFTEHLGRAIPDRFKYDMLGKVSIVPIRYGFFVGLLLAPFVTASICCSFCNFTQMQNIISAATGNVGSWLYVSSTSMITLALWLVPLGLLTKGGRGWCNFLCPAGALMNLVSGVTGRFGFLPRVRHDPGRCTSCGTCREICPPRAVDMAPEQPLVLSQYLCNTCLDCVKACPTGALHYGRDRRAKIEQPQAS